jgi:hypothetical protein
MVSGFQSVTLLEELHFLLVLYEKNLDISTFNERHFLNDEKSSKLPYFWKNG